MVPDLGDHRTQGHQFPKRHLPQLVEIPQDLETRLQRCKFPPAAPEMDLPLELEAEEQPLTKWQEACKKLREDVRKKTKAQTAGTPPGKRTPPSRSRSPVKTRTKADHTVKSVFAEKLRRHRPEGSWIPAIRADLEEPYTLKARGVRIDAGALICPTDYQGVFVICLNQNTNTKLENALKSANSKRKAFRSKTGEYIVEYRADEETHLFSKSHAGCSTLVIHGLRPKESAEGPEVSPGEAREAAQSRSDVEQIEQWKAKLVEGGEILVEKLTHKQDPELQGGSNSPSPRASSHTSPSRHEPSPSLKAWLEELSSGQPQPAGMEPHRELIEWLRSSWNTTIKTEEKDKLAGHSRGPPTTYPRGNSPTSQTAICQDRAGDREFKQSPAHSTHPGGALQEEMEVGEARGFNGDMGYQPQANLFPVPDQQDPFPLFFRNNSLQNWESNFAQYFPEPTDPTGLGGQATGGTSQTGVRGSPGDNYNPSPLDSFQTLVHRGEQFTPQSNPYSNLYDRASSLPPWAVDADDTPPETTGAPPGWGMY